MAKSRARSVVELEDAYLPLTELAAYAGISLRTIEKFLADPVHPLPYYRFGSRRVVRVSEYDAWAREHHRVTKDAIDVRALVEARISGRK